MTGCATNCEMDGSSGGAAEGLKPRAASEAAIGCAPETAELAGTAGCAADGATAGMAATGAAGGGAALGAGAELSVGVGADESSAGGGGAGGGVLAAAGAGACAALGGGGGAAAGSVPPRSASEL